MKYVVCLLVAVCLTCLFATPDDAKELQPSGNTAPAIVIGHDHTVIPDPELTHTIGKYLPGGERMTARTFAG